MDSMICSLSQTSLNLANSEWSQENEWYHRLLEIQSQVDTSIQTGSIDINIVVSHCRDLLLNLRQVNASSRKRTNFAKLTIFNSVLEIIDQSISDGKDVDILMRLFLCLVWQVLVNPFLGDICPSVMKIFSNNIGFVKSIMDTKFDNMSHVSLSLFLCDIEIEVIDNVDRDLCIQFITFITHLIRKLDGAIKSFYDTAGNVSCNPSLEITAIILKLIQIIDVGVNRELCSLLLLNEQSFLEKLVQIRSQTCFPQLTKTLVDQVLIMVSDLLLPKYPQVYVANTNILPSKASHYQFLPQQEDSLQNSCNLILSVLENGNHLSYFSSLQLSINLVLANSQFHQVCKSSKLTLYTCFNKISSKISLFVTLVYQNYLISLNLLVDINLGKSVLPQQYLDKFKMLLLPPIPKSRILLETGDDSRIEAGGNSSSLITANLILVQIYILSTLLSIIPSEFNGLKNPNRYSSEVVESKIFSKFIDLLLTSTCSNLILCEYNSNEAASKSTKVLAYKVIHLVLKIKVTKNYHPLPWINLLDIAHHSCSWDIQLAPVFVQLFENLLQQNAITSDIVRQQIAIFLKKYSYEQPCLELLLQICPDLTAIGTKNVPMNELTNLLVNPIRNHEDAPARSIQQPVTQNFAAKAGRRQSTHVDEYEKKNNQY